MLIKERFPDSTAEIGSIRVDSDVVSLDCHDFLETEAEIGDDGKLRITVRKSNASRRSVGVESLSGVEIYSISSSAVQTPRRSNINQSDFYSVSGFPGGRLSNFGPADLYSVQWSREPTPRPSNIEDGLPPITLNHATHKNTGSKVYNEVPHKAQNNENDDAQVFARSTSAPTTATKGGRFPTDVHATPKHSSRQNKQSVKETRVLVSEHPQNGETKVGGNKINGEKERIKVGLDSAEPNPDMVTIPGDHDGKQMPSAGVMVRLIVLMVWRKLIRNPNMYASLIGLVWSLVSFRWHAELPKIVGNSISLISNTGLGMAMFSLGLFMALQPKLIACGKTKALLAMAVKFVLGPVVMAVAAIIVGLRGTLLHVAIVQATLSVGIVPFVFAKEYNVHPTILSTAVIFGMLITVPINLIYYIILQL